MTKIFREVCPPLVKHWYQRWSHPSFWSGNFTNWEAAAAECSGYDAFSILESVKRSALMVKKGVAAFERDSVVFDEPEYSWPLLSTLLHAAGVNGGRLRVMDFGGSLGSTYFQHRPWLRDLPEVRWCVVEQEHFVECGREHFQDGDLRFYHSIAECVEKEQPDVALLSSVLGYLPDPQKVVSDVINGGFDYVVVDRTGFVRGEKERITVQRVPPDIYSASYPCRFLNKADLIRRLSEYYELQAVFPAVDQAPPFAEFAGLSFKRRAGVTPS
ncbi:MAG TPA: methyltransferase, TIGR04325 family [Opitutaceae bacterium]|nr:methyltransferase, TIGR04325 family [Opitutaceae bacterium]